jgi:hypothetical protein
MAIEVLTNLSLEAAPNDPKHVVNIRWVEEYFTGHVKIPVRAVSTLNIAGAYDAPSKTLTYGATGAAAVDGVTLATSDRVLLAGQTDATQNGIYAVTVAGDGGTAAVLTRAADFDESAKIYPGVRVAVTEGTLFADTDWKLATDGIIVLDSTALAFVQAVPSNGAAKFSATITGDNVASSFPVAHNLGTSDVQVSVRSLAAGELVMTDVTVTDNNTVTVGFASAPAPSDRYRVTVIG